MKSRLPWMVLPRRLRYPSLLSLFITGFFFAGMEATPFFYLELEDTPSEKSFYQLEFSDEKDGNKPGRRIEISENPIRFETIPQETFFRIRKSGIHSVWGFWSEFYKTQDFILFPEKKEDLQPVLDAPEKEKIDLPLLAERKPFRTSLVDSEGLFWEVPDGKTTAIYLNPESVFTIATKDQKPTKTYYRINQGIWKEIRKFPLDLREDGEYVLEFYSEDLLGNKEEPHSLVFRIDRTPPVTEVILDGLFLSPAGVRYVSPEGKIRFLAKDSLSGLSAIYYRFYCSDSRSDKREFREYREPVPIKSFSETCSGPYVLEYYSLDRIGNRENPGTLVFGK